MIKFLNVAKQSPEILDYREEEKLEEKWLALLILHY